jgi:hypothetical protein
MPSSSLLRCRVAACPVEGSGRWDFVLINDGDAPLGAATLEKVSYEWGGYGHSDAVDVRVGPLAAGAFERIWQDDGGGIEGRMDLLVRVRRGDRDVSLLFEFPILYKKRELPVVRGIGRPGWDVADAG